MATTTKDPYPIENVEALLAQAGVKLPAAAVKKLAAGKEVPLDSLADYGMLMIRADAYQRSTGKELELPGSGDAVPRVKVVCRTFTINGRRVTCCLTVGFIKLGIDCAF